MLIFKSVTAAIKLLTSPVPPFLLYAGSSLAVNRLLKGLPLPPAASGLGLTVPALQVLMKRKIKRFIEMDIESLFPLHEGSVIYSSWLSHFLSPQSSALISQITFQ